MCSNEVNKVFKFYESINIYKYIVLCKLLDGSIFMCCLYIRLLFFRDLQVLKPFESFILQDKKPTRLLLKTLPQYGQNSQKCEELFIKQTRCFLNNHLTCATINNFKNYGLNCLTYSEVAYGK